MTELFELSYDAFELLEVLGYKFNLYWTDGVLSDIQTLSYILFENATCLTIAKSCLEYS